MARVGEAGRTRVARSLGAWQGRVSGILKQVILVLDIPFLLSLHLPLSIPWILHFDPFVSYTVDPRPC